MKLVYSLHHFPAFLVPAAVTCILMYDPLLCKVLFMQHIDKVTLKLGVPLYVSCMKYKRNWKS